MKKIGIVEIAKKFGVAPSTVSRAIHGSNRVSNSLKKEIMKYVREINYQPPSPAKNIIGLAFSMFWSRGYCPELMLAFRKLVSSKGLRLEIIMPESMEYLDFRMYRGIAAFFLDRDEMGALCERAHCPVVTINEPPELEWSNYSVVSDDVNGISAAGELLYNAGHRHIAMLMCELTKSFNNINRRAGYEEFCRKRKIVPMFLETEDRDENQIIDAINKIRNSKATGLILHSAFDTFYLIHKAKLNVPEELSVVLFNDEIPIEKDPVFFAAVQDFDRIAEASLEIIEAAHKQENISSPLFLPYKVYPGQSIKTIG